MSRRKQWTGNPGGTTNGAAIKTLRGGQTADIRRYVIETLAGSVRVMPSLFDSDDYTATPLVLSQEPLVVANVVTEDQGTFAAATTVGTLAYFFGEYGALKFEQVGATPASIRILGTEA